MSGPIVRSGPSEKFTENWGNVFGSGKKQPAAKQPAAKQPAAGQAVDPAHPETKWIGTIPFDVFYDQPLQVASDATPVNGGLAIVSPKPPIDGPKPPDNGGPKPEMATPGAKTDCHGTVASWSWARLTVTC